jgi:hypothetical protein
VAIAEEILERRDKLTEFETDNYISAVFRGCEVKVSVSSVKQIKQAISTDDETQLFSKNLENALVMRSGVPYQITDVNIEDDGDMYIGVK